MHHIKSCKHLSNLSDYLTFIQSATDPCNFEQENNIFHFTIRDLLLLCIVSILLRGGAGRGREVPLAIAKTCFTGQGGVLLTHQ